MRLDIQKKFTGQRGGKLVFDKSALSFRLIHMKCELDLTVELERDIEVTATFHVDEGFDGIGHYQFQGQKCFDKGKWRIEGIWFEKFACDEVLTDEEKTQIQIWLENYAESAECEEKLAAQICES